MPGSQKKLLHITMHKQFLLILLISSFFFNLEFESKPAVKLRKWMISDSVPLEALCPAPRLCRTVAPQGGLRQQLRPANTDGMGLTVVLLHRVPHERHPESIFPPPTAYHHRGVLCCACQAIIYMNLTLADSAVITLLGEDADRYGHQRMFGSLGWGLAMFFVGIALDHSTAFPEHPCGPEDREKNYTICFATFSVLMGAAFLAATQINFRQGQVLFCVRNLLNMHVGATCCGANSDCKYDPAPPMEEIQVDETVTLAPEPPLVFQGEAVFSSKDQAVAAQPQPRMQQPAPSIGKTKMFAQTLRQMPEWVTVLKQFANVKCGSFLFVAWFMGFGIGLIFTFLFWHLQDYGGSPTLFGVASVINHISEIFAYFFSFRLIRQMGHVKVLCVGLVGNVFRFLYISWLKNPWWVLPFEFMQGITHAAVWAACCSYIAHNTPQHLRSSGQGVLQGIHHGLGRGCGAVIGGMFVNYFVVLIVDTIPCTTATFRGYGVCCLLVLAAFVFINFYHKDTGFVSDLPPQDDPHQVSKNQGRCTLVCKPVFVRVREDCFFLLHRPLHTSLLIVTLRCN
ncbi:hypothetical protein B566_EDAN005608 [Ephemera danica]|nr:hypothetical protein B566_EDAN005608 [Ephemera danica]